MGLVQLPSLGRALADLVRLDGCRCLVPAVVSTGLDEVLATGVWPELELELELVRVRRDVRLVLCLSIMGWTL